MCVLCNKASSVAHDVVNYCYSDLISHIHTHTHTHTHTQTQTHTHTHMHKHTYSHTAHSGTSKLTHPYKYIFTQPVVLCAHSSSHSVFVDVN